MTKKNANVALLFVFLHKMVQVNNHYKIIKISLDCEVPKVMTIVTSGFSSYVLSLFSEDQELIHYFVDRCFQNTSKNLKRRASETIL